MRKISESFYVLASVSSLLTYLPSIFEWLYIKHFIGHSRLNRTRQIVTDLDRWQTFMTLKISGIFDVFLMVSNSMRSFPPHKDSRRRGANSFNFYRQHNHIIWISQFCPHILWIIHIFRIQKNRNEKHLEHMTYYWNFMSAKFIEWLTYAVW